MKKLVKILVVIIGLAVVAMAAVFYFTADMVSSADTFFAAVGEGDIDGAYTHLSEDFRASTSKEELEQFLSSTAISDFKEASWSSRSVNSGRGTLTGTIATQTGGSLPLTLTMVKEGGDWKVFSIQKPPSGIQEESGDVPVPDEEELVRLVNETMLIFAESVNAKSMAGLHAHISNLWQQQNTVEQLDEAFTSFFELGADLTVLRNYSPVFSGGPTVDENGVLVISGHYPTQPSQVNFEHKYIYEGLSWKLLGLSTNIQ